jgi:hypothetical protein
MVPVADFSRETLSHWSHALSLQMKSDVENMETTLNALGQKITVITENSTGISKAFAEKRSKIRKIGGRYNLLKKASNVHRWCRDRL